MSKITNYLNEHLDGDVVSDDNTRRQFATDGSILTLTPSLIVHPRVADDVRKVARFTWRLAERGQVLPLTARGNGSDQTGAALSRGTILSFPAHMAQIMEFDLKYRMIRVQAGIDLYALNQAVSTQGLCLPVENGVSRVMTVGGALANNLPGRQFAKYGTIRDWTDKLEVVLSNGEIIQTGRISRRELSAKKGLQTLEGEIYRSLDNLIDDNPDIINLLANGSSLDDTVYALDQVKGDDGSFDLTPLFIGSQGTLGIITQAILKLDDLPAQTAVVAAALTGDENLSDLINRIMTLEPSAIEFIDGDSLKMVRDYAGCEPWSEVTEGLPYAIMFVEFDDRKLSKKLRKLDKIMQSANIAEVLTATDPTEVETVATIRDCVSAITNHNDGGMATLPLTTELAVSSDDVFDTVDEIRQVLAREHVEAGIWGNVGSGLITVRPVLNLANLGQRQRVFRLLDKLRDIALKHEGSISGCSGAGRLLMPWAKAQYDKDVAEAMQSVRKIFDPYGVLNTGVMDYSQTRDDVLGMLRQDFRNDHFSRYNLRG